MPNSTSIDLIPSTEKKSLENKGKLMYWSLTAGRVVIVFTMSFLVLLLFLKARSLNNIANVDEDIQSKATIIKAQNKVETELTQTQARINIMKQLKQNVFLPSAYSKFLIENKPEDITIRTALYRPNEIFITAESNNLVGFSYLINNILEKPQITELTLVGATLNTSENTFTFELSIKVRDL